MKKDIKSIRKSISYLKRSVSIAKKTERNIEFAKSLYELANILLHENELMEGKSCLKQARKIFKKNGSIVWLERIEELLTNKDSCTHPNK